MTRWCRLRTWPCMQNSFHKQPFVSSMGVDISLPMICPKWPQILLVCKVYDYHSISLPDSFSSLGANASSKGSPCSGRIEVDTIVCAIAPHSFDAIACWYDDSTLP